VITSSRAVVEQKVDLLFSLFDFSESGRITYDEMVILAASVLSGAVKITGKGHLPEDTNMERLIDQAYLDVSPAGVLDRKGSMLASRHKDVSYSMLEV
jgi:Ca2+-binding EF-hand superfamily protein